MTVQELVDTLGLTVFCGKENLNREIKGGYTSDLLSDVMGHAKEGMIWITLQTHKNVLAIASLKELSAILLVKESQPEEDMLEQAVEEGIPVLGTSDQTFETTGKVYQLIQK